MNKDVEKFEPFTAKLNVLRKKKYEENKNNKKIEEEKIEEERISEPDTYNVIDILKLLAFGKFPKQLKYIFLSSEIRELYLKEKKEEKEKSEKENNGKILKKNSKKILKQYFNKKLSAELLKIFLYKFREKTFIITDLEKFLYPTSIKNIEYPGFEAIVRNKYKNLPFLS